MSERSDDDVLKSVLEGSPIGAAILDVASGKRLFVNSQLVTMFGAASADDLLNNDIQETWVDPNAFTNAYAQFSKGELLVNVESERRRFDGTRWWVLMNTQPITFETRKAGIVWHIDISDRKNAEAQILQAKKEAEAASHAKSDFLAHVSHELRTPLNSILGFSQMLSTESATGINHANRIEYAKNIFASGGHLLGIINDILDLSKIEAGKFELDRSAFDITDVLMTAQQMMNSLAELNGVTMKYAPSADPISLFADKRVVTQIIVNLLSNAIKFNNKHGRVTLAASVLPDGGRSITVADTGIGIAKDDFPRILAPFGQVRTSSHRAYGGTGLGLSLSKYLVELHGGALHLFSTLGQGTTVEITFPPAPTEA